MHFVFFFVFIFFVGVYDSCRYSTPWIGRWYGRLEQDSPRKKDE